MRRLLILLSVCARRVRLWRRERQHRHRRDTTASPIRPPNPRRRRPSRSPHPKKRPSQSPRSPPTSTRSTRPGAAGFRHHSGSCRCRRTGRPRADRRRRLQRVGRRGDRQHRHSWCRPPDRRARWRALRRDGERHHRVLNGVAVENLTVKNYFSNGVFFTGDYDSDFILRGYRVSYVNALNNRVYGIYAFNAEYGLFDNTYAAGHTDSGYYIGQCQPCNAVLSNNLSEYNTLAYSGTNAGGDLFIVNNEFRMNRIGVTPNTLNSEELARSAARPSPATGSTATATPTPPKAATSGSSPMAWAWPCRGQQQPRQPKPDREQPQRRRGDLVHARRRHALASREQHDHRQRVPWQRHRRCHGRPGRPGRPRQLLQRQHPRDLPPSRHRNGPALRRTRRRPQRHDRHRLLRPARRRPTCRTPMSPRRALPISRPCPTR